MNGNCESCKWALKDICLIPLYVNGEACSDRIQPDSGCCNLYEPKEEKNEIS